MLGTLQIKNQHLNAENSKIPILLHYKASFKSGHLGSLWVLGKPRYPQFFFSHYDLHGYASQITKNYKILGTFWSLVLLPESLLKLSYS